MEGPGSSADAASMATDVARHALPPAIAGRVAERLRDVAAAIDGPPSEHLDGLISALCAELLTAASVLGEV